MSSDPSVTRWLNQLQQGDRDVVEGLWQEYYPKLVRLATSKLRGLPPRLVDAEELAHTAFNSFCLAAEKKRFPKLADRDDLWQVLMCIVRNKAAGAWEHHTRAKRDFRREAADVLRVEEGDSEDVCFLKSTLQSSEPTPEMAADVAERCERLLSMLPDDELRQIAVLKMEGYTNKEIADRLDYAPITVDRRLGLIRKTWLQDIEPTSDEANPP